MLFLVLGFSRICFFLRFCRVSKSFLLTCCVAFEGLEFFCYSFLSCARILKVPSWAEQPAKQRKIERSILFTNSLFFFLFLVMFITY